MELIDKSALVAEIERLREIQPFGAFQPKEQNKTDWLAGKLFTITSLEIFLDTLEVKEVDYERELSKYVSNGIHRFFPNEGDDYYNMDSVVWQDYVIETAKHFFELGLKAQKGE